MFGISFAELMIISLLILVVLGPEKLPEVAKWAGKGMRELRQASNTLRDALMIDDLDPRTRHRRPSLDNKLPRPSQAPRTPPPTDAPPAAKAPTTPQYPSAEPLNIDQLDDASFDRILEREYRIHHNQLLAIELAPSLPSEDLEAVELAPPFSSSDSINETVLVDLPASRPPEYS